MPNDNGLEGIHCQRCGQQQQFHITATITCLVTDRGSDPLGDHYWDEDSLTYCPACEYQGLLKDFRS